MHPVMACRKAEEAQQRVEEADSILRGVQHCSAAEEGNLKDRLSQLAIEEHWLHGEASKAVQGAQAELAAARREKQRLEDEREEAVDKESAHVFESEQLAKQADLEYESALRAQEMKVRHVGGYTW